MSSNTENFDDDQKTELTSSLSSNDKHDTESDISTDSSSNVRKTVKSPHTVLKNRASFDNKISLRPSQYEYQTDQYKKLLQEAEQSVSSRDVLITMLQDQLKKMEELYKHNLDQMQDFRFKYCITMQELSSLKKISEKYKEDIEKLLKDKAKNVTDKEILNLKKELDNWKEQYEDLFKKVQERADNISKEIQVDLEVNSPKSDIDVLESHYLQIENTLKDQNKKMELIISKLPDNIKQSEDDKSLECSEIQEPGTVCITKAQLENVDRLSDKQLENKIYLPCEKEDLENYQVLENNVEDEPNQPSEREIYATHATIELCETKLDSNNDYKPNQQSGDLYTTYATLQLCNMKSDAKNASSLQNQGSEESVQSFNPAKCSSVIANVPLEEELKELRRENLKLEEILRQVKENDKSKEMGESALEIIQLNQVLKERDKELELVKEELENSMNTKNLFIDELNLKNETLKRECEEMTRKNVEMKNDLEDKTCTREKLLNCLCNSKEKLKVNNDELSEQNNNLKREIDDKIIELSDKKEQIRILETQVDKLELSFEQLKAETEEKCGGRVSECQLKIERLEKEIEDKDQTLKNIELKNRELLLKVSEIRNSMKQYKEEAEFKKLENQKLICRDSSLEGSVSYYRKKSEQIERDLQRELEKNKTSVLEITDEYNNYKVTSQSRIQNLSDENRTLQSLLQTKNDEIKKLKDDINTVTKELESTNMVHKKNVHENEKSLDEITILFKSKEEKLLATTKQLEEQYRHLLKIKEENQKLKDLLGTQKSEFLENFAPGIKQLEDKYTNEKIRNENLNCTLQKIRKELDQLKGQLYELLQNIEIKIRHLKKEFQISSCNVSTCASGKSINDMLESIEKFNDALNIRTLITEPEIEQQTNSNSSGGKKNRCCNCSNTKNHQVATTQTVLNIQFSSRSTQNCLDLYADKLLIQKQYLIKQLESIDAQLNALNLENNSETNKILIGGECAPLSSDFVSSSGNTNEKSIALNNDTSALLFKQKHFTEKISEIDKQLAIITSGQNNENEEKCSCSSNPQTLEGSMILVQPHDNLQVMQKMLMDLKGIKVPLLATKSNSKDDIIGRASSPSPRPEAREANLDDQIRDLQKQSNFISVLSEEIDRVKQQLSLQHYKLHQCDVGKCTNTLCNGGNSQCIEKTNDDKLIECAEDEKSIKCIYYSSKSKPRKRPAIEGKEMPVAKRLEVTNKPKAETVNCCSMNKPEILTSEQVKHEKTTMATAKCACSCKNTSAVPILNRSTANTSSSTRKSSKKCKGSSKNKVAVPKHLAESRSKTFTIETDRKCACPCQNITETVVLEHSNGNKPRSTTQPVKKCKCSLKIKPKIPELESSTQNGQKIPLTETISNKKPKTVVSDHSMKTSNRDSSQNTHHVSKHQDAHKLQPLTAHSSVKPPCASENKPYEPMLEQPDKNNQQLPATMACVYLEELTIDDILNKQEIPNKVIEDKMPISLKPNRTSTHIPVPIKNPKKG